MTVVAPLFFMCLSHITLELLPRSIPFLSLLERYFQFYGNFNQLVCINRIKFSHKITSKSCWINIDEYISIGCVLTTAWFGDKILILNLYLTSSKLISSLLHRIVYVVITIIDKQVWKYLYLCLTFYYVLIINLQRFKYNFII